MMYSHSWVSHSWVLAAGLCMIFFCFKVRKIYFNKQEWGMISQISMIELSLYPL